MDGTMIEAWAGQKSLRPKRNDDALKRHHPPVPGRTRQWIFTGRSGGTRHTNPRRTLRRGYIGRASAEANWGIWGTC